MSGLPFLISMLTVTPAPTPVSADVPIYLAVDLPAETLQRALDEVDRIFEPGGVHWHWVISPNDRSLYPSVTVVVQPRPKHPVIQGCSRNLHDHRLGYTQLPSRRITLWTEQVARAVDGEWDRTEVPSVNDRVFARALGRVLAHELGHLFLRMNGHEGKGLMRASFTHRWLTSKSDRHFRLSPQDLEVIYAALAQPRERGVSTPP